MARFNGGGFGTAVFGASMVAAGMIGHPATRSLGISDAALVMGGLVVGGVGAAFMLSE